MNPLILLLGASSWALPTVDTPLKTGVRTSSESAVVIGIEDYAFLDDVPHASRDAAAFYDFLVYTRGVPADQVRRLDTGASREKILAAVEQAAKNGSGPVWLYFAGHGAASPSTGERMLLGVDAQADVASFEARSIKVREIQDQLGSRSLLMVMDTCYSGKGRTGGALLPGQRFAVPDYALSQRGTDLQWTAAGPDQTSGPLEEVSHGAFTYLVLGALRGWADGQLDDKRDGKVTAEEAQLFVSQGLRALNLTGQTPVLETQSPSLVLSTPGPKAEAGPSLTLSSVPASTTGGPLKTFSEALTSLEAAIRTGSDEAVWQVSVPSTHFQIGKYDAMDEVLVLESAVQLPGTYPSCWPRSRPDSDALVVPPERPLVVHVPRATAAEVQRAWEQRKLTLQLHFLVSSGKISDAASSHASDCPGTTFEPRPSAHAVTASIVPIAGQLQADSGMIYGLHQRDLYGTVRLVEVPGID